jgi:poly(3-hydroxybutyrate) depolymerase
MMEQFKWVTVAAMCALFAIAGNARASKDSDFLWSPAGSELNYRLFVPQNYDPTRSYPVIIYLHGSGELGTNNSAQLANLTNLYNHAKTDEYAAFILAPQAKANDGAFQTYTEGKAMPLTMQVLDQLIAGVNVINPAQPGYNVDPSRVYLTGISLGAYGVWESAIQEQYKGRFAALAPLAGTHGSITDISQTIATELALAQTPVWAFHGGADPTVHPATTRTMISRMQQAGGQPLHSEFYKWGHGIWDKTYNEKNLYQWMFNQSLNGPLTTPPPVPARDAARSVRENFSGPTLNPLFTDVSGNYLKVNNRLQHTTENNQRTYVVTSHNDFRDKNFIFEVTVHTQDGGSGGGIAFVGFGPGAPNPSYYGEPTSSIAVTLRPSDWHGGRTTLNHNLAELADFGQYGQIHGGGRHRIQIIKDGDLLTFNLDRDYNGVIFFTDHTYTIDLSTFGGLDADNTRLFFGTGSSFTTFEDLNLHVVVPEPGAAAVLVLVSGALLRRRRSAGSAREESDT